jgi:diguanylate cyclase (GGDEF)-like protein
VLSDEILLQGRKFLPHICVPLIIQGEARGVIHLLVAGEQSIRNWEQLAITLAERIALALANLELQETLRYQAIRDPLTGLFNRRYMEETLSRELRRSVRFKRPLGVIMLDIDHFKQFNDDFSYAAGDLLLQALGNFLQDSLRHGDVICRYGGEEFVLILPEASLEDTHKRAEHIRTGVTGLQIQHRGVSLGTITMSLGVAACPEHGEDPESILQAVDTALHKAKAAGRNHLVVADR